MNDTNTIYTVIKPVYLYCKIFGILPYTLIINNSNITEHHISTKLYIILKIQKIDYIIILIQVVFIVMTILCFVFEIIPDIHESLYIKKESIIDSVSYIMQLTGLYVLIISDILVVYMHKQNIKNIFDNIYKMDYYLQQIKFVVDHAITLKFGKKLLTTFVISCILTTIPDYLNDKVTNFIPYIYIFALLGSVGINCFFIILCFDAKQKFILLKNAIIDLPIQQKEDIKLFLAVIMQIYGQLTKHSMLLHSTMNVVLLTNILNAFLALVTTIYYMIFLIIYDRTVEEFKVLTTFVLGLYWNVYNLSFILLGIKSFNWIVEQVFTNILINHLFIQLFSLDVCYLHELKTFKLIIYYVLH